MRTQSFEKRLAAMPDGMAKRIYLKILNTPPPDYARMDRICEEYERERLAEMAKDALIDKAAE